MLDLPQPEISVAVCGVNFRGAGKSAAGLAVLRLALVYYAEVVVDGCVVGCTCLRLLQDRDCFGVAAVVRVGDGQLAVEVDAVGGGVEALLVGSCRIGVAPLPHVNVAQEDVGVGMVWVQRDSLFG